MTLAIPRDRPLEELLVQASHEDLSVIADIITDNGKGRVSLDSTIKGLILLSKRDKKLDQIADVLAREIQSFGSNTLSSLFSSKIATYSEIAKSSAARLGKKQDEEDDTFACEEYVIAFCQKVANKNEGADESTQPEEVDIPSLALQISDEAISASGILAGASEKGILGAVGYATKKAMESRGGMAATTLVASRLAFAASPWTLALGGGGGLAYEAAGPAYRVTIPVTLMVGHIRRKRYNADIEALKEEIKNVYEF